MDWEKRNSVTIASQVDEITIVAMGSFEESNLPQGQSSKASPMYPL